MKIDTCLLQVEELEEKLAAADAALSESQAQHKDQDIASDKIARLSETLAQGHQKMRAQENQLWR